MFSIKRWLEYKKSATHPTITYHKNTFFCRAPISSILGFIIRTYKKVGFGSLRYTISPNLKAS